MDNTEIVLLFNPLNEVDIVYPILFFFMNWCGIEFEFKRKTQLNDYALNLIGVHCMRKCICDDGMNHISKM